MLTTKEDRCGLKCYLGCLTGYIEGDSSVDLIFLSIYCIEKWREVVFIDAIIIARWIRKKTYYRSLFGNEKLCDVLYQVLVKTQLNYFALEISQGILCLQELF